MATHKLSSL